MTKIPLTENSVIEISLKVKLTVADLEQASKIYYDTNEEKLVDSQGRVWSPLMLLENIGETDKYNELGQPLYQILTSDEDFENELGLSIIEYTELETHEPYKEA